MVSPVANAGPLRAMAAQVANAAQSQARPQASARMMWGSEQSELFVIGRFSFCAAAQNGCAIENRTYGWSESSYSCRNFFL